jgi:hypothetical protein
VERITTPATLSVLIVCPVCGESIESAVTLAGALSSRFGKGRLTLASRASRFEHACGQGTLDGALDRAATAQAPDAPGLFDVGADTLDRTPIHDADATDPVTDVRPDTAAMLIEQAARAHSPGRRRSVPRDMRGVGDHIAGAR